MSIASASTLTTAAAGASAVAGGLGTTSAGTATSSTGVSFVPGRPDFLLTWSGDIRLYRIAHRELVEGAEEGAELSPSLGYRLSGRHVAEICNFIPRPPHYIKCVSVASAATDNAGSGGVQIAPDVKLAVGEANGRVSVLSFARRQLPTRRQDIDDDDSDIADNDKGFTHVVREFCPRSTLRAVNDVAWNKVAPYEQYLAAGYDKSRNEGGILIYDAELSASSSGVVNASVSLPAKFSGLNVSALDTDASVRRPTVEMGAGETCHSLAWLSTRPTCLVAGMNNKSLKIFDARVDAVSAASRPTSMSSASNFTRAVHGVCVDPFLDFRVASRYDNHVVIWDTRNFDKPIVTLTQPRRISQMAWSPTRAGLLCSSMESSPQMTIHDIQSWVVMSEDGEPAVTERSIVGFDRSAGGAADAASATAAAASVLDSSFVSFSWSPVDESAIVGVTQAGKLSVVEVTERIAPSWSALHNITWAHGRKLQVYGEQSSVYDVVDDVSVRMYRRTKANYGAEQPISKNAEHVAADKEGFGLAEAWRWLDYCGDLVEKDAALKATFGDKRFPGVRTALLLDNPSSSNAANPEVKMMPWRMENQSKATKTRKTFQSAQRLAAQKLCGWSAQPDDLAKFVARCESIGDYSRAAAVAIFCQDVKSAILVLERGAAASANPDAATALNFVALSLSGFDGGANGQWSKMVRAHSSQMSDAYLRAAFEFLSSDDDACYKAILELSGIELTDKISFSCLYLSEVGLNETVERYWMQLKEIGDLRGLIFCGMCADSVSLLQHYLDHTGDVQSVCWLAVHCLRPAAIAVDAFDEDESTGWRVQRWFAAYRELLDCWQMWSARAQFDCAVQLSGMLARPPQQVFISCTFCGSTVARYMKGMPNGVGGGKQPDLRAMANIARQASSRRTVRVQACPQCRKPLPRCAVCLTNMGNHSGLMAVSQKPPNARKLTQFETFFTWCQTCRHGGHADHLVDWFSEHAECPVADCGCRCSAVDPTSSPASTSNNRAGAKASAAVQTNLAPL